MSNQSDAIVVFITAPTQEEARILADKLVETQLAACVQVLPEMESVYRWEGKVERQNEHLLIAKTTSERFAELDTAVRELHSYDTPEIVSFRLTAVSSEYLRWLQESVASVNTDKP
jgi:periplasmic divalent cation tolerance protein